MGKSAIGLDPALVAKLVELDTAEPFASMSIDEALIAYNTSSVEVIGVASSSLLNEWAATHDIYPELYAAAADVNHPAFGLAKAAINAFENTSEPLDLSKASIQGMVTGLVTAGIIPASPDAAADLYHRVTTLTSPGRLIGIPKVRRAYLESIRGVL